MKPILVIKSLIFLNLLLIVVHYSNAQIINTVAGTDYIPNNVPALETQLNAPSGITVDANNNIYFCDVLFGLVRKINTSGLISTVAGSGQRGYSGDGGPATLAAVNGPASIILDQFGNKYFADAEENVVRKVSSTGIISTVAGTGVAGFSGDGGSAVIAMLNYPTGICLDSIGNLYIVDQHNNRIRKVSVSGIITTVVGTGVQGFSGDGGQATSAQLNTPNSVRIRNGNIYIADVYNCRIRKVNSSGVISTIAGTGLPFSTGDGGPASSGSLVPLDLGFDQNGNIYITDFAGNKIRKITASSNIISTVTGTGTAGYSGDGGPATAAQINFPSGIFVKTDGTIFFCDANNSRVRKIDVSGIITTIAGTSHSQSVYATNWKVSPNGIALNKSNGEIVFTDFWGFIVRKVDLSSGMMIPVAGNGIRGYSGDGGLAVNAKIDTTMGVYADASGIYISDAGNARIRKINNNGIITTIAGNGQNGYSGDGGQATAAKINFPMDLKVYNNNLYFIDNANGRIRKIDLSTGIISTIGGNGTDLYTGDGGPAIQAGIGSCNALEIDNAGNLFIAQYSHHIIRKINLATGIITTIAGTGVQGFSGDNGPASLAELDQPFGLAIDAYNNIYFSDLNNYRIRKINTSGIITTYACTGVPGFAGDGGGAILAQIGGVGSLDVDDLNNTMVLADNGNNRVRIISNVPAPDICIVTTDSLSQFNEVVWDKTNYFNVDSFIVYREISSSPVTYAKIGALSYDALSKFTDTNRVFFNSNFLPNGDPEIGLYRYKLKIRDLQNNYSFMSNYHNTVYLIDLQNGTFEWNLYDIENSVNPVSSYFLYRDTAGLGNWEYIGSVTGSQTFLSDPDYFLYQNVASWRVIAEGFSCTPTRAGVHTSRSNIKRSSNPNSINSFTNEEQVMVFPNPANDLFFISAPKSFGENYSVDLYNSVGDLVLTQNGYSSTVSVCTKNISNGLYILKVKSNEKIFLKKIILN